MLNIVIPMAGNGNRFQVAGYKEPKPLIPIHGKPMIRHVLENLRFYQGEKLYFICQKAHVDAYKLKSELPGTVIETNTVTQGTACSVLLAEDYINNTDELIIANSDQWFDFAPDHFLKWVRRKNADGCLLTMHGTHPKWSYVRLDDTTKEVIEVAEKNPISSIANVGVYYFREGRIFCRAAKQMIEKDVRVNGEFFAAPVYNEIIEAGGKVLHYPVAEFHGLGVPEDLEAFKLLRILGE